MKKLWRDHSLTIVLLGYVLVVSAVSLFMGWNDYTGTQEMHGAPLDPAGFWHWWLYEYSAGISHELIGAVFLVLATKKLKEKGSPESGDDE